MHPIERLRYVARTGDADPGLLAEEAAMALGSLAYESRALVPACRRLLEAHPTCGPLWWVAARLLVADDPEDAGIRAADELAADPTAEELAATFPAGATVAISARASLGDAVSLRPDLSVLVVGTPYRIRSVLSRIEDSVDACGVAPDALEYELDEVQLVVLESLAAGPDGFLLDPDQAGIARLAERTSTELWITTGTGRVLPGALFDVMRAAVEEPADTAALDDELDGIEDYFEPAGRTAPRRDRDCGVFVPSHLAAAIIGPTGAELPGTALSRSSCSAPSELLGFGSNR